MQTYIAVLNERTNTIEYYTLEDRRSAKDRADAFNKAFKINIPSSDNFLWSKCTDADKETMFSQNEENIYFHRHPQFLNYFYGCKVVSATDGASIGLGDFDWENCVLLAKLNASDYEYYKNVKKLFSQQDFIVESSQGFSHACHSKPASMWDWLDILNWMQREWKEKGLNMGLVFNQPITYELNKMYQPNSPIPNKTCFGWAVLVWSKIVWHGTVQRISPSQWETGWLRRECNIEFTSKKSEGEKINFNFDMNVAKDDRLDTWQLWIISKLVITRKYGEFVKDFSLKLNPKYDQGEKAEFTWGEIQDLYVARKIETTTFWGLVKAIKAIL